MIIFHYNIVIHMQISTIPIWEEKGIIIGLFAHIIKNHTTLQTKTIIINNDLYGSIIKLFFHKLKLKKQIKSKHKDPYFVNIKTINNNGKNLSINNLNNLQIINSKKITLLPWYDKDNPIVMFYHDDNINANLEKINNDIKYFEKHIRYDDYDTPGKTKTNCIIDCWDTYYEVKILKKYVKLYQKYNVEYVNDLINNILLSPNCCNEPKYIPYSQPNYVPEPKVEQIIKYVNTECPEPKVVIKNVNTECPEPKVEKVIEYVKSECPEPIINKCPENNTNDKLLDLLNRKIEDVNSILSHNID